MTMAQAYTRFMILFFLIVGIFCIVRPFPFSDAPGRGLIFWPRAAKSFYIFLINWFHFVLHMGLAVVAVFAHLRTSTSRAYARFVFWSCAALVAIGLFTKDGLWLVPARWPDDIEGDRIRPKTEPSWYGFIPANPADDFLNALVAVSGFVFGYLPLGLRRWGFWRE
jgi:hypothetical protein